MTDRTTVWRWPRFDFHLECADRFGYWGIGAGLDYTDRDLDKVMPGEVSQSSLTLFVRLLWFYFGMRLYMPWGWVVEEEDYPAGIGSDPELRLLAAVVAGNMIGSAGYQAGRMVHESEVASDALEIAKELLKQSQPTEKND